MGIEQAPLLEVKDAKKYFTIAAKKAEEQGKSYEA